MWRRSSARLTAAGCGSSRNWSATTPRTSIPGSSGRAKPNRAARGATSTSGATRRISYADARIIFKDFETSNWTWDPVAGAYYWHRFYSHQPDLNFDNPRVRAGDLRRPWTSGCSGAWTASGSTQSRTFTSAKAPTARTCPRPTSSCANCAATSTSSTAIGMLLAEANQWPEESAAYFGNGDECHMAFNFPVMPRMFMAIRMEDRLPIVDIVEQTPPIPETAQWALFLRNHDELTLEMVTDEERDYMYRVYADDPRARINLGIRRRLAPLLGNHRRRIELMNGLLFSLPGTPVIYYGDEIGMGDNVYLGDRDSVRTPMQWNGDRNAGFSTANREAAVPARGHRPGAPFRGGQRLRPAGQPALAAVVDQTADRAAQAPPGVRARRPANAPPGQPPRSRFHPQLRRRDDPGRGESVPLLPAARAGPGGLRRSATYRDVRAHRVSTDRTSTLPAEPRAARIPVVLARATCRRRRRRRLDSGAGEARGKSDGRRTRRPPRGCPDLDPAALDEGSSLVSGPRSPRQGRRNSRSDRCAARSRARRS